MKQEDFFDYFIIGIIVIVVFIALGFVIYVTREKPEVCTNNYGHIIDCQIEQNRIIAEASAPKNYNFIIESEEDFNKMMKLINENKINITINNDTN